jgi:hypothetical protein
MRIYWIAIINGHVTFRSKKALIPTNGISFRRLDVNERREEKSIA